jgi:ABC-type phosphate/phosphonate transport system ATPase subunit
LSVPVLALRGLSKAYRPGQPVLRHIDLDLADEGVVAIIGPSGTGKSTLIRCINRLVDPRPVRSCSVAPTWRSSRGAP